MHIIIFLGQLFLCIHFRGYIYLSILQFNKRFIDVLLIQMWMVTWKDFILIPPTPSRLCMVDIRCDVCMCFNELIFEEYNERC